MIPPRMLRLSSPFQGSADRYFQEDNANNPNTAKLVPEGIEGQVPYKGSVVAVIFQLAGGL
ncbi:MAG TPA: IMP dehydrogenase, partial [Bryobacteraceae bacterium]